MVRRRQKEIMIASASPSGDGVGVKIKAYSDMYSAKDRKILWKYSMLATLAWWWSNYMPLRFTGYVRKFMQYMKGTKGKDPRPLRETGRLMESVMGSEGFTAVGTSRGSRGRVSFTGERYIDARGGEIRRVLETVPRTEAERVARYLADTFIEMAESGNKSTNKRGRTRMALGGAQ